MMSYDNKFADFPVTDLDIQAYIDDELTEKQAQRVLKAFDDKPHLRERYKQLARQKDRLRRWWLARN